MDDRTCDKCGKEFQFPSNLKIHQQRKTPCQPNADTPDGKHICAHCGRGFAYKSGLYRHVNHMCKRAKDHKPANTPPTVTPQETDAMQQQIAELTRRVEQLTAQVQPAAGAPTAAPQTVTNIGAINTVINQQIHIHPWNSDRPLQVSVEMIAAAFAENKQLVEFCESGDHAMADYQLSGKYIVEAFMDLTKRAHQNPAARNIRLNPHRADQALVFGDNAKWDACPISDATRIMFDSISDELKSAALPSDFNSELLPSVQNGASYVRMQYRGQPEQYINDAKPQIVAHLANITPKRPGVAPL